jgi:hypothetical protein
MPAFPTTLRSGHSVVDVFFLRCVNPHDLFNRFDNPLSIADKVAINLFRGEMLKQPSQMEDLAMCPAHRRETYAICKYFCQPGIHPPLIVPLMGNNVLSDQTIGFIDEAGDIIGSCVVDRIGNSPQLVESTVKSNMVVTERTTGFSRDGPDDASLSWSQGPRCIEDKQDIYDFLHDGGRDRRKPAYGRRQHGEARQPHTGNDALNRDSVSLLGDDDRRANPNLRE